MTATKSASKRGLLETIDNFLVEVNQQRQKAGNTEAGGFDGNTTHPVKDVDDGTRPASEGSRSGENTSDNKAEPNRGDATVDATPEASTSSQSGGANQDSVQLNIGTTQAATGEDSSSETDSAKDTKEDPGSSHPARTDNSSLDGNKYASYTLEQAVAALQKIGEEILSDISNEAYMAPEKKKDTKQEPQKAAQSGPAKAAALDPAAAAAAGWELASLFNADGSLNQTFDKRAADAMVANFVEETIAQAEKDADSVAEFLIRYSQEKQAIGGSEEMPPEEGGGGENMGGEEPGMEEILQMLLAAGGGDQGAAAAGAEGGAAPPMPPEAGVGAGEPADQPEEGADGGDDVAMLESLLQEMNANPEQVVQAAAKRAAEKKAAASQKFTPKTAAQVKKMAEMRAYLSDLLKNQ